MATSHRNKKRTTAQLPWPIIGTAAALLIVAVLLQHSSGKLTPFAPESTSESPSSETALKAEPRSVPQRPSRPVTHQPEPPSAAGPVNLSDEQVQARSAQLMQLAMNDDSASLEAILGELRNQNRAIRDAALEATIQFGSREAIPSLDQAAQDTADASERTQLLAAIEFLKLPSLTEVMLKKQPQQVTPASVSSR